MLVAFHHGQTNKLKIVAGSMRDAFGVQSEVRYSGIVESDGLPTRPKLKNTAHIPPEESSTRRPRMNGANRTAGARLKIDREFALASASLQTGIAGHAELTEISKHIMFEETQQGLTWKSSTRMAARCSADGSKVRMSARAG